MQRVNSAWFRRAAAGAVVLVLSVVLALAPGDVPARAGDPDRAQLLELTNRARTNRGIRRVKINYRLSRKAERHSEEMARRKRLYHSRNVGRYLKGTRWRCWAENVGNTSASVRRLHRLFMRSAAHRGHILDRRFDRVGIGIAHARGKYWATVVFYG